MVARYPTPGEAMPFGLVPVLERLHADGSPDPTLGPAGVVRLTFDLSYPLRLAEQADGKIIVLGSLKSPCQQAYGCWSLAMLRLMPDGSPDVSFGTSGVASADFGTKDSGSTLLRILSDGRILILGFAERDVGNELNEYFALAKYLPNGQPDADFGSAGKVFVGFGGHSGIPYGLMVLPDGKLLVSGIGNWQGALVRLHANGMTDATFGIQGKVVIDVGANASSFHRTTPLADGRFLATGYYCFYAFAEFPVCNQLTMRYLPDGSLDPSFANGGRGFPEYWGLGGAFTVVDVDANGRILGLMAEPPRFVRFNSDGSWDRAFGSDGWLPLDMHSVATGTVLPDGKWELVGRRGGKDVLARILVDPHDDGHRNVPVTPRSGLWAVEAELNGSPGRGIQVDYQGGTLVVVVNGYESDGHSGFWLAAGALANGAFAGDLQGFRGGTPFGGVERSAVPAASAGQISLAFASSTRGTVKFPGEQERSIRKVEFDSGPTLNAVMTAVPGIWAISSEVDGKPGRGFMLESFGSQLVAIVDTYEYTGRAAFYLAGGTVAATTFVAPLTGYKNGTAFGSPYHAASSAGAVGNVSISLITSTMGEITLPGEPKKFITKLRFE